MHGYAGIFFNEQKCGSKLSICYLSAWAFEQNENKRRVMWFLIIPSDCLDWSTHKTALWHPDPIHNRQHFGFNELCNSLSNAFETEIIVRNKPM